MAKKNAPLRTGTTAKNRASQRVIPATKRKVAKINTVRADDTTDYYPLENFLNAKGKINEKKVIAAGRQSFRNGYRGASLITGAGKSEKSFPIVGGKVTIGEQIKNTKSRSLAKIATSKKILLARLDNGTATDGDIRALARLDKHAGAISGKSKPSVTPSKSSIDTRGQLGRGQGINLNSGKSARRLRHLIGAKTRLRPDGSYAKNVKIATSEAIEREMQRGFGKLAPIDKKYLLSGGRGAQDRPSLRDLRENARGRAKDYIEDLKFGRRRAISAADKGIAGSMRMDSDGKAFRVIGARHKGYTRLSGSQMTRKVVLPVLQKNKDGTTSKVGKAFQQVVYSSKKAVSHRGGKAQRAQDKLAEKARRAANKPARDALNLRTVIKRRARHAVTEANRRANENIVAISKKIQSQIKIAKKVDSSLGKKRTLKQVLKHTGASASDYRQGRGYLNKPASQLLPPRKAAKVARSVAGPKNAYPPMNHAGPKGKGPRSLIGKAMRASVSGKMSITHAPYHGTGGHSPAPYDLFSTKQTMKIPGRSMTGTTNKSGLMMGMNMNARIIINGDRTVADLQHKFPRAVKQAIVAASDLVGRRMLDIIEPYVPKDRGYMYQSGASNADQADTGMIGFANGVAFPAAERYGVTISYNTPYSEIVYFGGDRHGAKYNQHHGIQEKGPLETARWIEVAFAKQQMEFRSLLAIYATHITGALNSVSSTRGMKATVG